MTTERESIDEISERPVRSAATDTAAAGIQPDRPATTPVEDEKAAQQVKPDGR